MKNKITLFVFLLSYVLLCYAEKIAFDTVSRFHNLINALIIAGIAYLVCLLTERRGNENLH